MGVGTFLVVALVVLPIVGGIAMALIGGVAVALASLFGAIGSLFKGYDRKGADE